MNRTDIEDALEMFENLRIHMADADMQNNANMQVLKSLRNGLMEAGMSRSYADQLVATAQVNITEGLLDDEQLGRLLETAQGIGYQFRRIFHEAGFNDQAIALMGGQLALKLTE